MSDSIAGVFAWEALDSRGRPTVGCAVRLRSGIEGEAIVPSGASTGRHEAHELRDGGERYGGRGVRQAVRNVVEVLGPALMGRDPKDVERNDATLRELDGTPSLERLGANAVLAVSLAATRAAAASEGVPLHAFLPLAGEARLPLPMVNVVSGGAHAGGLVDIQDVLVIPVGAASFAEAIEWAGRVRAAAAAIAEERGLSATLVADEGGLAFPLGSSREAVELVAAAIDRTGLDAAIAVDVAASGLAHGDGYRLDGRTLSAAELVDELASWCRALPIVSLEDPLGEDDWSGWELISKELPELQLLGDDLLVTSVERLERAAESRVANAVLVKPNQVGTVSDARRVVERAHALGYATVVSARSGDTEDAWLAD
ncbi:MAG TPA: phosphopyruvate hydratase, partial [Gaiellaceae bacterium]|nr:phosphopyruvate hydratase [Gaiellaceae bacterium]